MKSRDLLDTRAAYFMAVVETGSFSAAARQLHVSQPAVSQQVAQLEVQARTALLDRSGYRPVPTEAGQRLYRALRDAEDAVAPALVVVPRPSPVITIGFTGATQNQGLLDFTKSYRAANPDAKVSFRKASFDGCRDLLLRQEVDCCFGIEATFAGSRDVSIEPLFDYEVCVICSHDSPLADYASLTPADLADQPFVVFSPEYGRDFHRAFMENLRADGLRPHVVKSVGSFDELMLGVSIGEGIAITSRECVDEREVAAIPLVDTATHSGYVVARLADNQAPELLALIGAAKVFFSLHDDAAL